MAYVPGYEFDIFLSYSRHDDVLLPGRGAWVSAAREAIEAELATRLGHGLDGLKIFWDVASFEANNQLPSLLEKVRASATFLAFCSPNYQARPWTRQEMQTFWTHTQDSERVFAVEMLPLDDGILYPEPLQDINRTELWHGRSRYGAPAIPMFPAHPDWQTKITKLANDMIAKLRVMHGQGGGQVKGQQAAVVQKPANSAYRRILLAQTGERLSGARDELRSYLEQFGITVLPAGAYPQGGPDFARALAADLARSDIFVQLLGDSAGIKPPDVPLGYPALQFNAAREAGIKIVQWRSPELDLKTVTDEAHKTLLTDKDVIAEGFEVFKASVLAQAKPPPPPPDPPGGDYGFDPMATIFIGTHNLDIELAESAAEILEGHRCHSMVWEKRRVVADGRLLSKKLEEELEGGLTECDGLTVIYGPGGGRGIGQRIFLRYFKVGYRRQNGPAKPLAIIYADPYDLEKETSLRGLPADTLHIQAPNGVSGDLLNPILEALRQHWDARR
jgi:hypothetical protein